MWNVKNLVKQIFNDGVENKSSDEMDAQEEANCPVADGHQAEQSKRKSMDEFIAEKNNQTFGTENSLKPERKSI